MCTVLKATFVETGTSVNYMCYMLCQNHFYSFCKLSNPCKCSQMHNHCNCKMPAVVIVSHIGLFLRVKFSPPSRQISAKTVPGSGCEKYSVRSINDIIQILTADIMNTRLCWTVGMLPQVHIISNSLHQHSISF